MADQHTSNPTSHKHTNRLAAEHSPYLLQHAHNPVSLIFLSFYVFGMIELKVVYFNVKDGILIVLQG